VIRVDKQVLLLRAIFVFSFLVSAACRPPAPPLPDYGKVPHFEGVDSQSRPFTSDSLAGEVWIADFIYTNCPAECPRMTSQMRKVATQLQDRSDVRFLSISVDPDRDAPPVLQAFAQKFGAPTSQWQFLSVAPATVHELAYNTFHVGDLIGKMEHSTKFILVDKKGKIRGYYSTFEPDGLTTLVRDADALRRADS
jgi:protein SCO1